MNIENLDINTRKQIHNFTKNIIRKYYKGLKNDKLPLIKFVDNIMQSNEPPTWLTSNIYLKEDLDFKKSYASYIEIILNRYKESEKQHCDVLYNPHCKSTLKKQLELKRLLNISSYSINIPIKYLNENEIHHIIGYIQTGDLPVGQERIFNFIKKG